MSRAVFGVRTGERTEIVVAMCDVGGVHGVWWPDAGHREVCWGWERMLVLRIACDSGCWCWPLFWSTAPDDRQLQYSRVARAAEQGE